MDRYLIKYIAGAHAKTQNLFLYLEIGALNIEQTITQRRMMYLQTLLKRDDNEITKKKSMSHRRKIQLRVTGLIHMVKTDFNKVEMELNEEVIKNESK